MPFVHQTRDTFVPRLSRGQSNLNCAQHLQRCKRHQLGRTCRLHPVANMASKKQDAAKRSGVKPDEKEGINNWVCVSDEQYEVFLKKLAACSKPKQFKTVICSKQGVRALVLYDPDKKVFLEKCTGRKVQRFELAPGSEIAHMSEVGRALLVGGEHFQQVFDRTVTANMMRNGVTGHH